MFSVAFFGRLVHLSNGFHVDTMQNVLRECFEAAEGGAAGIGHVDFWHSGGKASGLNSAAVSKVYQELVAALHRSSILPSDL